MADIKNKTLFLTAPLLCPFFVKAKKDCRSDYSSDVWERRENRRSTRDVVGRREKKLRVNQRRFLERHKDCR